MTYGVKAGALLALTLGCSTRSLILDLKGDGGRSGGIPFGGNVGTGGGEHRACVPGDDGPRDRAPPVAFDATMAPGAPVLIQRPAGPLGGAPRALAVADLDADGRPDLVVTGDEVVSVLVNVGAGGFAPRVDYPITAGSTSIAIGDVNGDKRPDIVVGGEGGGSVELLINSGEARFRNVALCLCGGLEPSVALGDLDGDGSLDIVLANRLGSDPSTSGDLVVLLNDDVSPFQQEPAHYAAGPQPRSVAVGDVNGDNHPDVVVAGVCSVSLLLNAGDGHLGEAVRYETLTGTVALADVDGDGDLDIVDTGHGGWSVDVLLNAGGGHFGAPSGNAVASPAQTAIGDLDGDGRVDLVVAEQAGDYGLGVLLGTGGGLFGTLLQYPPQLHGGYQAVVAADVDGDGKLDVATAGEKGVTVFLNRTP